MSQHSIMTKEFDENGNEIFRFTPIVFIPWIMQGHFETNMTEDAEFEIIEQKTLPEKIK